MSWEFVEQNDHSNFFLRLSREYSKDARTYNLPMFDEVVALIVGDFDSIEIGGDINVKKTCGDLCRLYVLLFFPYNIHCCSLMRYMNCKKTTPSGVLRKTLIVRC